MPKLSDFTGQATLVGGISGTQSTVYTPTVPSMVSINWFGQSSGSGVTLTVNSIVLAEVTSLGSGTVSFYAGTGQALTIAVNGMSALISSRSI